MEPKTVGNKTLSLNVLGAQMPKKTSKRKTIYVHDSGLPTTPISTKICNADNCAASSLPTG